MSKEQQELIEKIQSLLKKKYGDTSLESMRKLFDLYDKNHDSRIDGNELEQLLKDADVGNSFTRGMWVKGIVSQLDKNGDREVDWEEFAAVVK
jgi:Ca2+-binding EF-hand superfamily protein